jgi:hypothetical protein
MPRKKRSQIAELAKPVPATKVPEQGPFVRFLTPAASATV